MRRGEMRRVDGPVSIMCVVAASPTFEDWGATKSGFVFYFFCLSPFFGVGCVRVQICMNECMGPGRGTTKSEQLQWR